MSSELRAPPQSSVWEWGPRQEYALCKEHSQTHMLCCHGGGGGTCLGAQRDPQPLELRMGPSWGAGDDPNPTLLQAAPRTHSAVTAELSCHPPPAPPHSTVSQGWCIGSTPSRPQTQRMHLRSVMEQNIPSTALSETPNTITSPRPHGDPPSRHIPRASQRPHIPSCLQAPVETPPSHHIPRASWRPLIPSCPQVLIETSHPIMSPSPRGDPPHPIAPPEPHGDPTSHHTPKPFWRPPPPPIALPISLQTHPHLHLQSLPCPIPCAL